MKQRVNIKRRNHDIQEKDKVLLSTKNLTDKKLNKSFIEIFKIKSIKRIIATLQLSETNIFSKFYVELLKKASSATFLATNWFYEKKQEYEVEKIVKEKKKTDEFLIKWKEFSDEDNTWESRKNLKNAQEAIRKFRKAT